MQQQTIMKTRPCRKCGYDLIGLEVGGKCPECGEPIRAVRKSRGPREGTMTDAPPAYVKGVLVGFALMSAGVMGGMAGVVLSLFGWLGAVVLVLASAAWFAGVWVISRPRPPEFAELENPILDAPRSRLAVRLAGGAWPVFEVLLLAAVAASSLGVVGGALAVLAGLAGLAAFVGLITISVYVAEIEFWMSDDTGGWQLRGAAWMMTIFGVLSVVLFWFAPLFGFMCAVVVLVGAFILMLHIVGCVSQARWVLRYQQQNEGRAERVTERLRDRAERGGTVAGSTPCLECGYELRGLPHGGRCPECGTSYADLTPFPMMPRPVRDETPIEIDETGPVQTIRPAVQHFSGKKPGPVDETPIPLAGDDGDLPEDLQDPTPSRPEAPPEPADDDGVIPLDGDDEDRGR